MMLFLFLGLTVIPALEIYLLILVGGEIGALHTVLLLVAMGLLGAVVIKQQGRNLVMDVQLALARGEIPHRPIIHGALVLIGGILMITPGFFTDFLGLMLVLPGPRHLAVLLAQRWFRAQLKRGRVRFMGNFHMATGPQASPRDVTPQVIDITAVRAGRNDQGKPSTED